MAEGGLELISQPIAVAAKPGILRGPTRRSRLRPGDRGIALL